MTTIALDNRGGNTQLARAYHTIPTFTDSLQLQAKPMSEGFPSVVVCT